MTTSSAQLGAATTTDNQLFCYDEQNRLSWAGATGTSPCSGPVSAGALTSEQYSQAYTYDAQGRLTSGAIGSADQRASTYHPDSPHANQVGVYFDWQAHDTECRASCIAKGAGRVRYRA